MKHSFGGGFGITIEPTRIIKELGMTIPMSDLMDDALKNTNISNLVGEFFNDNTLKKNSISSIMNELLTNGLKYSQKNSDIKINTYMEDGMLCILMENYCTDTQLNYLNRYLKNVISSKQDAYELYIQRSIKLSTNHRLKRAQLGLISLISNFGCMLDIQTKRSGDSCIVSTKVIFQGV